MDSVVEDEKSLWLTIANPLIKLITIRLVLSFIHPSQNL